MKFSHIHAESIYPQYFNQLMCLLSTLTLKYGAFYKRKTCLHLSPKTQINANICDKSIQRLIHTVQIKTANFERIYKLAKNDKHFGRIPSLTPELLHHNTIEELNSSTKSTLNDIKATICSIQNELNQILNKIDSLKRDQVLIYI